LQDFHFGFAEAAVTSETNQRELRSYRIVPRVGFLEILLAEGSAFSNKKHIITILFLFAQRPLLDLSDPLFL